MYLRETCFENGMPAQLELYLISLPVQRKIYVCMFMYLYTYIPYKLSPLRRPQFVDRRAFASIFYFSFVFHFSAGQ